jgi:hypothetical protein
MALSFAVSACGGSSVIDHVLFSRQTTGAWRVVHGDVKVSSCQHG